MHPYVYLFDRAIPSYGLCITTGVLLSNLIAYYFVKKKNLDWNDFIILECFCMLGAFFGAKILFLVVSFEYIDWKRFIEPSYFNTLMQSGFVFYGGLIGGLPATLIAAKAQKIDARVYIRSFIFLVPLIHSFGRVGCFLAGCCYGIPYSGPGCVVFPNESFAIPGVHLFPIQIVEAVCLFLISVIIFISMQQGGNYYTVELYFVLYGTIRLFLENLRYDSIRGMIGGLYTSQWISILLILTAIVSVVIHKVHLKHPYKAI